jgi:thiol-disulfide isomerase/thioredoxin
MKPTSLRATFAVLAITFVLGLSSTTAQTIDPQEKADMAWNHLKRYLDAGPGLAQLTTEVERGSGYLLVWETYTRVVRRYGLRFYDNFPNDPRRLRWLPWAFYYQPRYWQAPGEGAQLYIASRKTPGTPPPVIPLDEAARDDWEKRYPQLREEFYASPDVSETERAHLRLNERFRRAQALSNDEDHSLLYAPTPEGQRCRQELQQEILGLGRMNADWASIEQGDAYLGLAADTLLDAYWLTGERRNAVDYIAQLTKSPSARLNTLALGHERIMSLTKTPMEGRFASLDGHEMDFAKLRGKVVLIQYWSLSCSGCIAQMPKLKRLYEKYHGQGLELVGYCTDPEAESKKVGEFVAKRGLPWPQRVDARLFDDYKHYSFTAVSNLLLLDKEGKLAMHSSGPSEAHLEAEIRRELGLKPTL